MKTSLQAHQKPHSGITLIELTVVMLVIMSLVGVIFFGATAWKRGSDRTNAILLIRGAQIGVRSHNQIQGIHPGSSFLGLPEQIFGEGKYVANGTDESTGQPKAEGELPDHPVQGKSFGFVAGDGDLIPAYGELYICTGGAAELNDLSYNPAPLVYESW